MSAAHLFLLAYGVTLALGVMWAVIEGMRLWPMPQRLSTASLERIAVALGKIAERNIFAQ